MIALRTERRLVAEMKKKELELEALEAGVALLREDEEQHVREVGAIQRELRQAFERLEVNAALRAAAAAPDLDDQEPQPQYAVDWNAAMKRRWGSRAIGR